MNARTRRFPLFDSIRGIAAILVVIRHGTDATPVGQPDHALFSLVHAMGGCALALFFVVSGFLLFRPFLASHVAGGPRPRFGAFAMRRFLRIAPGYWVALTITAIVLAKPLVFSDVAWQFYGLVYIYFGHGLAGIGPAWSLCIEIAWYVFLPLFVLATMRIGGATEDARLRRTALAVGAVGVAGIASRIYFSERNAVTGFEANAVPAAFLDWLSVGMGLAVASVWLERREERLPRAIAWLDRFPGIAWAAAGVALLVASGFVEPGEGFVGVKEPWTAHLSYGVFSLLLIAPAALGDESRGLVRRLMANRALLFAGVVSYGIFLWHVPLLEQFYRWGLTSVTEVPTTLLFPALALAASTAIATVSYYAIERPALKLARWMPGTRRKRPKTPASDPAPAAPGRGR